jgi:hypothetical protein
MLQCNVMFHKNCIQLCRHVRISVQILFKACCISISIQLLTIISYTYLTNGWTGSNMRLPTYIFNARYQCVVHECGCKDTVNTADIRTVDGMLREKVLHYLHKTCSRSFITTNNEVSILCGFSFYQNYTYEKVPYCTYNACYTLQKKTQIPNSEG